MRTNILTLQAKIIQDCIEYGEDPDKIAHYLRELFYYVRDNPGDE